MPLPILSMPDGEDTKVSTSVVKVVDSQEALTDEWSHDPLNPHTWTLTKKWTSLSIISLYAFITPLGSSMMAPALPQFGAYYQIANPTIQSMTLSVFLLAWAIAPLVICPLSEMYGRRWVLHISNIVFMLLNVGCALAPSTGALITFRFLSGVAGSSPVAIGGGCIGDLFAEQGRASAMAVYSLGPLIGPTVGPVIGGFVAEKLGIRYIFVVISSLSAAAGLIGLPLLRETYGPVIQYRRARAGGDLEKAAQVHPIMFAEKGGKMTIIWQNISRPAILLTRSLVCFALSGYTAFLYATYYLLFSTFASLYSEVYNFNQGTSGAIFIGLGAGFILATLIGARFADNLYAYLSAKNGGKGTPEMRIPMLIFGSLFIPIGLLWYGWSAHAKAHWVLPIIGTGIFGFGMMTTFLPVQIYLVDVFTYAASAFAAASVLRSFLGFIFPLFGTQMYDALGIGGGNTLLAAVSVVFGIPFPVYLYYRGEKMRQSSKYTKR